MKNPIFWFDIKMNSKRITTYLVATILFAIGIFSGNKFNLTVGEGVYLNGSYTIGFMIGLLSLCIIFIATVVGNQLLFKEQDTNFGLLIFTTKLSEKDYVIGRFASFFLLSFLFFFIIILGFIVGQNLRSGDEMSSDFHLLYYIYPLLVFGGINSLFVCSCLFFIAFKTQNRILTIIAGLLLYVFYMVSLVYSGSPFMSNVSPQSGLSQKISAFADPFGLSAYFLNSNNFTVIQRNNNLVDFSGYFLINRIGIILISTALIFYIRNSFSFQTKPSKKKNKKIYPNEFSNKIVASKITFVQPAFNISSSIKAIISFIKIDLKYTLKSVVFIAATTVLLFYIGMELFAEIEKGVRIPQQYASSGLMAQTINQNFYLLGLLLTVYFVNDICWKSSSIQIHHIENTTFYNSLKTFAHWISVSILILIFSSILILESVIFQLLYKYMHFDFNAYLGVFLFNALPLLLLSALIILINTISKNKYLALGISVIMAVLFATPVSSKILHLPIFRFLSGFNGVYSDFIGYGFYAKWFAIRLVFGAIIICILWLAYFIFQKKSKLAKKFSGIIVLLLSSFMLGKFLLKDYNPKDEITEIENAVAYEKKYRNYQKKEQPTVTDVITKIDLFPDENAYVITGTYTLKNLTNKPIHSVLINFNNELKLENAVFSFQDQQTAIEEKLQEIVFNQAMQPNEKANLKFKISYKSIPVNGHQSFNAILENGSFMRISRYFPTIGYQADNEIQDEQKRKEFALGKASTLKKLEAPNHYIQDFINLDMTISTNSEQTAIGTGTLTKQWKQNERNYFQYKNTELIPFRFAVSSAKYAHSKDNYKGIDINVFYHPSHSENVNHLIESAKLTLDYCTENFGSYPFQTLSFAEISAFTSGFNATAYPNVIFMTENVTFHANNVSLNPDVVNELAAHEVAHYWWGNNQISPDEREGAMMLTETFAMYTEMMIYKKVYGVKKMNERVKMHQDIYDSEKGFSKNMPLYKVDNSSTHISYSKGAVAMVELSNLIGEKKLNDVLKQFLYKYKYPHKATTLDFLHLLLEMTDEKIHSEIKRILTFI